MREEVNNFAIEDRGYGQEFYINSQKVTKDEWDKQWEDNFPVTNQQQKSLERLAIEQQLCRQVTENIFDKGFSKFEQDEDKVDHPRQNLDEIAEKVKGAWSPLDEKQSQMDIIDSLSGDVIKSFSESEELGFNSYQKRAASTAVYPPEKGLEYAALALAGETGEAVGEVSKTIRDDGGKLTDSRREKLFFESGDILWTLSALCTECGFKLENVAKGNLKKLADRKARGVLGGSGNKR